MAVAKREMTYVVDGLRMVAHLARPDGEGPWPAVLIGHDGVGLDDYQRQRADDLAASSSPRAAKSSPGAAGRIGPVTSIALSARRGRLVRRTLTLVPRCHPYR